MGAAVGRVRKPVSRKGKRGRVGAPIRGECAGARRARVHGRIMRQVQVQAVTGPCTMLSTNNLTRAAIAIVLTVLNGNFRSLFVDGTSLYCIAPDLLLDDARPVLQQHDQLRQQRVEVWLDDLLAADAARGEPTHSRY
jgi:hypothetical protein